MAALPNLTLEQEQSLVEHMGPCDLPPRRSDGPARRSFNDPATRRARDTLLMHHEGYIRSLSYKGRTSNVSVPDLHQHLLIVALEALASYNGNSGARVSWWLKTQLQTPVSEFVARTRGAAAIPGSGKFRMGILRYNRARAAFVQDHGREPDHVERRALAADAGTTLANIEAYDQSMREVVQIGGDASDDTTSTTDLADTSAPGEGDQVSGIDNARLMASLREVVAQLSPRELVLLEKRLMPNGKGSKRSSIAKRWGESETFVEISEVLLTRKLRDLLAGAADLSPADDGAIILPCPVRGPLYGQIFHVPKPSKSRDRAGQQNCERPEQLRLFTYTSEFRPSQSHNLRASYPTRPCGNC